MVMLHSLWSFVGAIKAGVIEIAVANACGGLVLSTNIAGCAGGGDF